MSLSIRNRLPGTVDSVVRGQVMATVRVVLAGGQQITAAVTLDAVRELGIRKGSRVDALIKSTSVSLATGPVEGLSIRNQLSGTVSSVTVGDAMATVGVSVAGGTLTSAVTSDAVADLGLVEGSRVVALVKSTEVALAGGSHGAAA